MKNFKNILWGVILIIIGIILGGNSLGLFDIDIFFDGWWALFIIIPSFVGLITDDDKTGNAVWMVIGLLLLAGANDIINFDLIWKMIVPIIIVIVGLSLIFKVTFNSRTVYHPEYMQDAEVYVPDKYQKEYNNKYNNSV